MSVRDGDDATASPDSPGSPVDLAAVRADDALLDAACRGSALAPGYGRSRDDERLADLLAAWRAEVEAEPMPELVSLDEAVAAIREGHHHRDRPGRARPSGARRAGRRLPWGLAVAAAGAIAVLGLGTAVHQAAPGEPLFGVTQVVFSSQAAATQREYDARSALDEADDAIAEGDLDAARGLLRSADARIGAVDSGDQEPLRAQRDRVSSSLAASPAAPPPAPAVPPVGGVDAATASESSSTTTSTTSTTPPTTTTSVSPKPGADGVAGSAGATGG